MAAEPAAHELTQQDAVAVATAATEAAGQGQEAARTAATEAATARGISDEDAQKVANMVIVALEARGAFEPPPAPAPIEHAAPAPAAGAQERADGFDPATAGGEPPPRRRTWAEKFVGRE